jgi:hypothetical protein
MRPKPSNTAPKIRTTLVLRSRSRWGCHQHVGFGVLIGNRARVRFELSAAQAGGDVIRDLLNARMKLDEALRTPLDPH